MNKRNFFFKFLNIINKSINNVLLQNLNKLNSNNIVSLARSNKIFLTIVALFILILSYLSIPNIFKESEVLKELNSQLNKKYNLNFKFSQNLRYNFFPRPHFSGNNTKIFYDKNNVSEVKKIKIFISLENLFSLKNLDINRVILEGSNFNLNNKNYNFFINLLDQNFKNTELQIIDSNIFYRNYEKEVLLINKILNMKYYYDTNEFKNIIYSKNEIFNIPYSIKVVNYTNQKRLYSKINIDLLRLQIENSWDYSSSIKEGSSEFLFNQIRSKAIYKTNQNFFDFSFFDKLENSKFLYSGKFNFKPFYSTIEGKINELNINHYFGSNAILVQLLKTEIFNNKNLNFNANIKANKIFNNGNFKNIFLNYKIQEGLIDIDKSFFTWKNNVKFNISESLFYIKDGELLLDGKAEINISDYNEVYKYLLTPKNYRKQINKIDLNYIYNFDQKIIILNDIIIDGKFDQKVNKIIQNIKIKNDDFQNKIYFKNIFNEAIKSYAG